MKGELPVTKRQLFENFINENLDSAYRFAFTYTKNREDAEDAVNESVIKALRSIEKLKSCEHIKTWFFKIIINTSVTILNNRKKIITTSYDDYLVQPFEDDNSALTFSDILNRLDEKYRSVIVLRFFEDMPIKDIAYILNVNENTVKTRLYTALKILKEDLKGDIDEEFKG